MGRDMSQHDEGENLLLGRLREATSGESSVRQLRQRYDALRADYEVLLDRLAELEERLANSGPGDEAPPSGADLVEACAPLGDVPELGRRVCKSVEAGAWLAAGTCRRQPGRRGATWSSSARLVKRTS